VRVCAWVGGWVGVLSRIDTVFSQGRDSVTARVLQHSGSNEGVGRIWALPFHLYSFLFLTPVLSPLQSPLLTPLLSFAAPPLPSFAFAACLLSHMPSPLLSPLLSPLPVLSPRPSALTSADSALDHICSHLCSHLCSPFYSHLSPWPSPLLPAIPSVLHA
jgi:hypothetical protein